MKFADALDRLLVLDGHILKLFLTFSMIHNDTMYSSRSELFYRTNIQPFACSRASRCVHVSGVCFWPLIHAATQVGPG